MELKELESKIQTLLKNENIKIKIEDNHLFIYIFDKPIYEIVFVNFKLCGFGTKLKYSTMYKSILEKHKKIIETCLLIDDDVENQLKALIKEYIY
ncbi:hypothetical protein [Brachyspira pilosicoli]|uniref:hypothetical protein n=1 Tax=Brachyspira pilosicoli TaxID=52584 RepID=UPI00255C6C23|nr:hypothetical protein [Brachyspira pilosicoli]